MSANNLPEEPEATVVALGQPLEHQSSDVAQHDEHQRQTDGRVDDRHLQQGRNGLKVGEYFL